MTSQAAVQFLSQVPCPQPKAKESSKTCRIIRLPNPRRVIREHDAAEITARLLSVAFAGRSENAVCEAASQALGMSENTIRAILRGETTRVDARILLQAAAYCMSIGSDPMQVAGLKGLYQKYCGGGW